MTPRRSSSSPAASSPPVRPRHAAPVARALALSSALLLGAVLTGCGPEPAAPTPSDEATPASATVAVRQDAPQVVPLAPAPDPTSPSAAQDADPTASGTAVAEDPPLTSTRVAGIWPDEDWEIADLPGDACAGTLPEATDWAIGEDYFRCGSADKRLLVCRAVQGGKAGEALCVRDPLTRSAARIRSSMLVGFTSPASEMPNPLVVVLADGTQCGAVPRDDLEHRAGRQSWLHCGADSALLLDQTTATLYFDREEPVWTAELEEHGGEPRRVEVREVLFAASDEDLRDWGFTAGLTADEIP